jgi:hypothetical protein
LWEPRIASSHASLEPTGSNDEVKIRTTAEFIGDPAIVVAIQSKVTPRLLVRLTHFQLSGCLQFTLAPLMSKAPYVGAFSMLFMDTPSIRCVLPAPPRSTLLGDS